MISIEAVSRMRGSQEPPEFYKNGVRTVVFGPTEFTFGITPEGDILVTPNSIRCKCDNTDGAGEEVPLSTRILVTGSQGEIVGVLHTCVAPYGVANRISRRPAYRLIELSHGLQIVAIVQSHTGDSPDFTTVLRLPNGHKR